MKKYIIIAIIFFASVNFASASWLDTFYADFLNLFRGQQTSQLGASVFFPYQGGTGIGNVPTYGKMLVGNSGGTYTLTATSSLGISGAGGEANTGSTLGTGLNIFDSKSGVDLRFNTIAAGTNVTLSTTTNANTIVVNSTGGAAISTSPNSVLVSDSLGTSAIASSSPTVNYLTATSTTATSTFAGGIDLTSSTGMGLNFGSNTLFYQNNQRFLTSSTTVAGNLTIGYQSATNIDASGGLYNTGLGYQALSNATSTSYNTAVGYQALKGSATISNTGRNTAVGYLSLTSNTTGASNTANGYRSLYSNTTGSYNTANGIDSLYFNTTGSNNTADGFESLRNNTTGGYNTANGLQSLNKNTTGNDNIANGYASLYFNTTGVRNTTNGSQSLYSNTTGAGNIGLGYYSGYGDSTIVDQRSVIDNYMTFIGYQASRDGSIASTTALTNGIAIGKNARVGGSNMLVLGGTGADAVNVAIGTTTAFAKLSIQNTYGSQTPLFDIATSTSDAYATSSIFRVNADGNVGIGTTSPNWKLSVAGIGSFDDYVRASYFTATSTTATSTLPRLSITTGISILGEYFENFTTYVRSLFTAGTGISISSGQISVQDNYLLNTGDIGTGAYDFGGATSVEIPNGASPTVDAIGETAWDTTSGNLIIATSTTGHIVIGGATTSLYAFSLASTSPDFASGGIIEMPTYFLPQVATAVICKVDGGTSQQIFLSDGTNDTNTITCTTTETQYALTSNNSFNAYEQIRTEFVTKSGAPDYIIIRYIGYRTTN